MGDTNDREVLVKLENITSNLVQIRQWVTTIGIVLLVGLFLAVYFILSH